MRNTARKSDFPALTRAQRRQMVRLEDKEERNMKFVADYEEATPRRMNNKMKRKREEMDKILKRAKRL